MVAAALGAGPGRGGPVGVHGSPHLGMLVLGLDLLHFMSRNGVRSPGIYVYIYFLGSFGNLASLGSRMNGKWKLHGERPT